MPAHPNLNEGQPGRWQTCTNISRHAHPVARARPTTHADSIPPRRNGRPHGANPNAESDRVPGSAPGDARIGDDIFEQQMHSRASNAHSYQCDISIIHTLLATGLERLRPASQSKTRSSTIPDWIRRRGPITTHSGPEHPSPTHASLSSSSSFRAPPHMQALTLHVA